MGRTGRTTEHHLDASEVESVSNEIASGMSELTRGCIKADASKLFGEFASKSDVHRLFWHHVQVLSVYAFHCKCTAPLS